MQTPTVGTNPPNVIAPYSPLDWQVPAWHDKSLILLLTGSAGGGKSRVAAEKVHAYCKRYPRAMALMLRKTRESMTNSTVLYMKREIIADDPGVRHLESKNRFEYANGSILAYGGMKDEDQREQIRSIGQRGGLDMVWMEEAHLFSEADLEEVLTRLRGTAASWRQIIITTNPDAPTHWIYRRLIKNGEASVYYSSAKDNWHNAADYHTTLDRLTGIRKQRLVEGKWVQAEGIVYDGFSAELHIIDRFPIPPDWKRYRVIDFGYTNPFVCQWWAEDHDGRLYLYREIYRTGRIVQDHAADITRLSEGERYEFTVADHDAEDRATLDRYGISTIAANKAVTPGIQAVQDRLRVAGDDKPRLYFFRDALDRVDDTLEAAKKPTCTLDELPAYVWHKSVDGKPNKETPVKEDDHGMDAMRYMCMAMGTSIKPDYFFVD